jgi:hypothetical protein
VIEKSRAPAHARVDLIGMTIKATVLALALAACGESKSSCEDAITHAVTLLQNQYAAGWQRTCQTLDDTALDCMIAAKDLREHAACIGEAGISIEVNPTPMDPDKKSKCDRALANAKLLIAKVIGTDEVLAGCKAAHLEDCISEARTPKALLICAQKAQAAAKQ